MSAADRKARRNLGGTHAETVEPFFGGPDLAEARTSIVLVERLILAIIRSEVSRLRQDEAELTRFFSHFFDPLAGETEREKFVANFISQPPVTVLGYPRSTAEFPCFSVILESEEEDQNVLAEYVGETLEEEDTREPAEYLGAVFNHTYGIYVYAQHPDVVVYLYQFVKMVLFGAKPTLVEAGLIDIHFSGGELSPEEMYLPDNMFARVLRITTQAVMSVPVLTAVDPRRLHTSIFMDDIVVDGIRGGVTPIADVDD
jgi:hypothetical protein